MSASTWNELIAGLPNPHLLQTSEWATVKRAGGWRALFLIWGEEELTILRSNENLPEEAPLAACLLLIKTAFPLLGRFSPTIAYAPKGPNLNWKDPLLRQRVLADLSAVARDEKALFIKIDPDILIATGEPNSAEHQPDPNWPAIQTDLNTAGFFPSAEQIQFRNSVLLDVTASPEMLLEGARQKTRYNIRLAERKGVTVRQGGLEDADLLYKMYAETALRDGFIIREKAYYLQVWREFAQRSAALIAEVDGEPVAAVYLFHFAGVAYYLYGMSRDSHREKMPNALLQYRAALWAQENHCSVYDLWGAPDVFDESDSMWGVYKFKRGFGGVPRLTPGAFDAPINRFGTWLYTRLIPSMLDVRRWFARRRAAREQK